jgi:ribokinase
VVGDLVTDVLVVTAGALEIGSDATGTVRFTGGGQAANTAAWLAHARHGASGPNLSGSPVTLIAAVGDDDAGRARIAELTALGVRCAVRVHVGATTGSVLVLASAGERTMVADRGANLLLAADDVTAAIGAEADPRHLHLSGYPLLDGRTRPAGVAALTAARDRGATTSVDAASAAPLARLGAAGFLDLIRGVDLLLANADEAAVLAGPGPAERQAAMLARVARHVVVKRGGSGAVWCGADGVTASVAAVGVHLVDPTGAGDAFAAGLLAAWCAGADPGAALAAGAALGARAVGRVGARPGPGGGC